jgi:hypothetical protein
LRQQATLRLIDFGKLVGRHWCELQPTRSTTRK